MKRFIFQNKILIATLVSVATTISSAQGNLQFNQVLTYSGTLTYLQPGNGFSLSPQWTVPQGKVWKIENKTPTGVFMDFLINNTLFNDVVSNNTGAPVINNRITWLKEGDVIFFRAYPGGVDYFVSIIEFNVIK